MNNSPIDRSTLKSYFVKNAVPTQQQFAELIDSIVNYADDGLSKQANTSLSVQASTGKEQSIIELYRDFLTRKPVWRYQLNPLQNPDVPNSSRPGLALRDDKARMRLYLQEEEVLAGFGTIDPQAALQVVPDMTVLRTVVNGNSTVQEEWTYPGLAADKKIALELGENGPGKIGSMKLNGTVANEFSFIRPGQGSLFLDTTAGDFYLNYDENIRRNHAATLHMAAADGTENIRLASQGSSWLLGGGLGLGTNAPESALHVRVAGATGTDFNALSGKISLQLGDASSKGSFLIQGGTANDRSFAHAQGGDHHLDASSGRYLINRGDVSQGKAGVFSMGDAAGAEAVRLQSDAPGFLRQALSIGGTANAAFLHVHVPAVADLGGKTGGILVQSPDAGTLSITGDSISSDQPLRLQPHGGEIRFGGSLDVEEQLSFDEDEFPGKYFISRDAASLSLKLAGEHGVSLENTSPLPPNGFQDLLHFSTQTHRMLLGMDSDHLAFETENQMRPLGIMKDGQVLINQQKPLGSPLAVRGRVDITGLIGHEAYHNELSIGQWAGNQNLRSPAQMVLSSDNSELAVAIVDDGDTGTITQAVFNEASGMAAGYQMQLSALEPKVLRWTFGDDLTGKGLDLSPPSEGNKWRGLHLDADQGRLGIGRGEPRTALDLEGSGTPTYGVQLLVRESAATASANASLSGATIGFASPHFSHQGLPGYDGFDIGNEGGGSNGLPADFNPVLTWVGLRNVVPGGAQNPELPHLEIGSRYDLPIDFRINGSRMMKLSANQTASQISIGVPQADLRPTDLPLTFLVNVPATLAEGLNLSKGMTLNTGKGVFKAGIEVTGLADLKNELKVGGIFTANAEAKLFGGLAVTGASTLNGNLTTVGTLIASGPLEASQTANLKNGVTVDGASILNGNTTVTGSFTVNSGEINLNDVTKVHAAMTAFEAATFKKTLKAEGKLTAAAGADISLGMTVSGATGLASLSTSGAFTANGSTNLKGITTIEAALDAKEAATFAKTVDVGGKLTAAAGAEISQGLIVSGTTSLATASTSGAFTANGSTNLKGLTTMEAALDAKEAATFAKTLDVTGKFSGNLGEFADKLILKQGLDMEGPADLAGFVTIRQDPGALDFGPEDPMLMVTGLAQVRYAKVEEDLTVEAPYIQVTGGQITVGGSAAEWYPVTIANESGRPALLEVEIWTDHDFYAKLRLFPAGGTVRLDYHEIEVFQETGRYVADVQASPTSPNHVVWLKGATSYQFRSSDKTTLQEGLPADLDGQPLSVVQTAFNAANYDFKNVHIRRGGITLDRFESLTEPQV